MNRLPAAPTLLALGALLASCSPRTIPLVIEVPPSITSQTEALEVFVVRACPSDMTQPPAGALASLAWRRAEASQPLPGALPERFGVMVLARDAQCAVVGSRCVMATRDDARVVVSVLPTMGAACAMCDRGLCTTAPLPDASVDAPIAPDANPDAPRATEPRCDCLDDDADMRVDEGCETTGGAVQWQSTFDGPGAQNFRSLVLGGDGRLYANGYMSERARAMCGGTELVAPDEIPDLGDARTWTLGFNAADGTCLTVFAHDDAKPAPFASLWRSDEGVWMFSPDGLIEVRDTVATMRQMVLNPAPAFRVGHVRHRIGVEPETPRVLFSFLPSRSGSVGVGTQTHETQGSLLVVADARPMESLGVATVTATNPNGVAAWMPDGRVAALQPNAPATLPACGASGASRVEILSSSNLTLCERAFGVDLVIDRDTELLTEVIGNTLWVIHEDALAVTVATVDLTSGTPRYLQLPSAPPDVDPPVQLAAAPDGTLVVGFNSNGGMTPMGDTRPGGYVLHLGRGADDGIVVLGERWMNGYITGLDVAPTGEVYVLSTADTPVTLCRRDLFVPMGAARVLTALDFRIPSDAP